MRFPLYSSLFVLLSPVLAAAAEKAEAFTEPDQAGPDFAVQGEYVGDNSGAQVIALGGGKFRVVGWTAGLPGTAPDAEKKLEIEGMRSGDKIAFEQQGWKVTGTQLDQAKVRLEARRGPEDLSLTLARDDKEDHVAVYAHLFAHP